MTVVCDSFSRVTIATKQFPVNYGKPLGSYAIRLLYFTTVPHFPKYNGAFKFGFEFELLCQNLGIRDNFF